MNGETFQNSLQNTAVNVPKRIAWVIFSSFGFTCMSMCVRVSGDVLFNAEGNVQKSFWLYDCRNFACNGRN